MATRPFLSIALFSLTLLASRGASAQSLLTFDDWTSICRMGDGCADGWVEGPDGAFVLLYGGEPCPIGKCLFVEWQASDQRVAVRVSPWTPSPTVLHAEVRFFMSARLWDQLSTGTESATAITLLRLETTDADTWADLILAGSPPRFELSAIAYGAPAASTTRVDGLDGPGHWVSVAVGVDASGTEGTIYTIVEGDYRPQPVALPTPMPSFTGARVFHTARYEGAGPVVVIDDFCAAPDRESAAECPAGAPLLPNVETDAGPDTGVPSDGAAGDAGRDTGGSAASPSFRGAGGCACRASGPSSSGSALLVVVLLASAWRRPR